MVESIKPSMFARHKPTRTFAAVIDGGVACASRHAQATVNTAASCMKARMQCRQALENAGLWAYDGSNQSGMRSSLMHADGQGRMQACLMPEGIHDCNGLASLIWPDADAIGGTRMERMIRGRHARIWHDGLSKAMRHALAWYCDVGYARMNAGLDGRAPLAPEDMQACRLANDACTVAGGLQTDAIMHRVIIPARRTDRNEEEIALYKAFKNGRPYVRRSFTSVSMRDGVFGTGFGRTHIVLRVHKGVHGLAVPSDVRHATGIDEHEFVIAPGAVMKVIGVFETGPLADDGMHWKDNHPVIAAEVFPQA